MQYLLRISVPKAYGACIMVKQNFCQCFLNEPPVQPKKQCVPICVTWIAYENLGEVPKAVEYHEQALKISREIGDLLGEVIWLFNVIQSLDRLGQRAKAIELAKSAFEIFKQIESPYAEQVRLQLDGWQE